MAVKCASTTRCPICGAAVPFKREATRCACGWSPIPRVWNPISGTDPLPHRSKHGAEKVRDGGYTFDSKAEYQRWRELTWFVKAGKYSDLQVHPVFQLRVCRYVADFSYRDESGALVVEDVKSEHTRTFDVYRLKAKMMLDELQITVKEVIR